MDGSARSSGVARRERMFHFTDDTTGPCAGPRSSHGLARSPTANEREGPMSPDTRARAEARDSARNEPAPRDPLALRTAWGMLRARERLRARDVAQRLGVSEAELVACQAGAGTGTVRLDGDASAILKRVESMGDVMALTRNESVVHEKVGRYENLSFQGRMGLALGDPIDLRLFLNHWRFAYAVSETNDAKTSRSLQFFDACGDAVHKIHLRPASDVAAFDALVDEFRARNQEPGETVAVPEPEPAELPDSEIDVSGLAQAWGSLKDTHEFFGLLRRFKVTRIQALRLAGLDYARRVDTSALRRVLERAAKDAVPIMVFVGNRGCIQIHTGPVENIKVMGDWLNVMDAGFNLHVRETDIAAAWIVKKPTDQGIVTSLEAFDREGRNLLMVFGKRKPDVPELDSWRNLVATLAAECPAQS